MTWWKTGCSRAARFNWRSAGPIGVNPDQRMHEDARHLTELSSDLALGLVQSSALLVSFVGVLWSISRGFALRLDGVTLSVPGYMVWAAIIYALSASLLELLDRTQTDPGQCRPLRAGSRAAPHAGSRQ